jgi:hypothetical protein
MTKAFQLQGQVQIRNSTINGLVRKHQLSDALA